MLKRFATVSVVSVMLASIWLTPAISAIINADTVDGLHASKYITAGYLLPLNVYKKFPNSVLYTGSGKGLDADKVDGQHISNIVLRNSPTWTPQTRHYSIGSSDWQSHFSVTPDTASRGVAAYSDTGEAIAAPIHLPDGAVINKVTLYYYDIDDASSLNIQLWSRNHVTRIFTQITDPALPLNSIVGTPIGWGNAQRVLSGVAAVNNAQSTYYALASFTNAGKQVDAVIIDYTITAP